VASSRLRARLARRKAEAAATQEGSKGTDIEAGRQQLDTLANEQEEELARSLDQSLREAKLATALDARTSLDSSEKTKALEKHR
jgi:hypothetical protein